MPFSSLSPEKQQFLSRYFKSKSFFRKGTSSAKKDEMADALLAFQNARKVVGQKLEALAATGINLSALTAELKSADDMIADRKSLRADEAHVIIDAMLPKIAKVGTDFCKVQKKRAKDAIDLVKTYYGMALETPKLEKRLTKLGSLCDKDPVDFAAVKALATAIVDKQGLLKTRSDGYRNKYDSLKVAFKSWCDDIMPTIADNLVKAERDKVKANVATAYKKLEEFSPTLAKTMASTAHWKIIALQKVIKEKDDYLVLKAAAEVEIGKIMAKRNPGVEDACKAIIADQAKAQAHVDAKAFYDATLIMKTMAARVAALLPLAQACADYETAAKAARTALEAVANHPQSAYVVPDLQDLTAHYEAAELLAAAQKYPKGQIRMEMLPEQCTALLEKAAKAAPYDALKESADKDDPKALLVEANKLLAALDNHPGAALIPQALAKCKTKIAALEALPDIEFMAVARAGITTIIDLLVSTRMALGTANMHHMRAVRLEEQVNALRATHIEAFYIKDALDKIIQLVAAAKAAAIKGEDGVAATLTDGEAQLEAANAQANAEELYRLKREALVPQIKAISKDSVSFPDKVKTLAKIDEHMKAAEEYSKAFNHVKTGGMMNAVEALLLVATIGTKANAGTPPSKDNIKKLIAAPNGQKILDDMIAALPPTAQQDVLKTVLEARFNMDVKLFDTKAKRDAKDEKSGTALDVPAPNLMAYYDMLKSVPDTHTKLNPSMARWDQIETNTGSFYSPTAGAVVMGTFTNLNAPGNPLGDETQLGQIDADAKPREDTPQPTYGKWTTMHEIGHAVDDRKGFMNKNGSADAYGGWTSYGSNIAPVAKAIAKHLNYDIGFIERTLAGASPPLPDIPPELVAQLKEGAAAEWTKRKTAFDAWRAGVSSTSNIWKKDADCQKWAINGVMYHEAYANSWVSYKMAARKKGVTGYQFRAPGEWFSELYAAFYTKKMNPNHPAAKWLATL